MKRPIICIYGVDTFPNDKFISQDTMTVLCCNSNTDLKKTQPDIIVTIGQKWNDFLFLATQNISHKWLHYNSLDDVHIQQIMYCYISNLSKTCNPTFSVFTPSYKSGHKISRPLRSLQAQTYPHWEWIIINDSPEDQENCQLLKNIEQQDSRIKVYSGTHNIANIGQHKFSGAMLGRGKYLVELDHDDDLTPDCFQMAYDAFEKFPDAGFVYTNFAELYEKDLSPFKYGVWGFKYGGYYAQMTRIPGQEKKKLTWIATSLNVNNQTIRNIVSVPNHIRIWKRDLYHELGGHNPLAVGDDYELLVRTFLKTKMVKIPTLGYYQYRNEGGNTTFQRNGLITLTQHIVRQVYEDKIETRLKELGCQQDTSYNTNLAVWENDTDEKYVNYIYKKPGTTVVITDNYEQNIKHAITLDGIHEIAIVGYNSEFLSVIAPYIQDDRVIWWNLEKEYNDSGKVAKRYAQLLMVKTFDVLFL